MEDEIRWLSSVPFRKALRTRWGEFRAENLLKRCLLCDFTVSSDTNNLLAISLPERPSEIIFRISNSRADIRFTSDFVSTTVIEINNQ